MQTEDLNYQAQKIADLRVKEATASQAKKLVTQELEGAEKRMLEMLEEAGLKTYQAPAGRVTMTSKQMVRLPDTPEKKAALYAYLQQCGKYDLVVKPNSQSLNSLWKEEFEQACEAGLDDYNMPGIDGVTINLGLSFTRSK